LVDGVEAGLRPNPEVLPGCHCLGWAYCFRDGTRFVKYSPINACYRFEAGHLYIIRERVVWDESGDAVPPTCDRTTVIEDEKQTNQAFLEESAAAAGAMKTSSGLIYLELVPGTGDTPKMTDRVRVNYRGTFPDGSVFDSSAKTRDEPATFALSRVIPCWAEGLQLMKVGGKSRFVCPPDIAFGAAGAPPAIKPGATLVFEVELVEVVK
jgi:hypothetical protein